MDSIEDNKPGRPPVPNRQGLYSKIAKHSDVILKSLFDLLDSKNENIRLGAAKVLLNKIVPDLRAENLEVQNNEGIKVNVIGGGYGFENQTVVDK